MREIVRTNDIVLISAIEALFNGANIHHMVLDQNMSVLEGSLGLLPRRILVEDDNVAGLVVLGGVSALDSEVESHRLPRGRLVLHGCDVQRTSFRGCS